MEDTTGIMLTCVLVLFIIVMVGALLNNKDANRSKAKVSATKPDFDRSYEGHGSTILTQLKEDWEEYLLKMPDTARGDFSLRVEISDFAIVQRMGPNWWLNLGYSYPGYSDRYTKTEALKNVAKGNLPRALFVGDADWVIAAAKIPGNSMKVTLKFERYEELQPVDEYIERLKARLEADPELRAELLLHGISIKLNEHNKVDDKEK